MVGRYGRSLRGRDASHPHHGLDTGGRPRRLLDAPEAAVSVEQRQHLKPTIERRRAVRWDRADVIVAIALIWLVVAAFYGVLTEIG